MTIQTLLSFNIIGVSVRTTNENNQAVQDIPVLWNEFFAKNISEKIPDKLDDTIYCIYTDYEKDHTQPYTALIGCKVRSLENIPEGLTGKAFNESHYYNYKVKGNLVEGAVFEAWKTIWNSPIPRAFTVDFEVYSEKAQNPENAEVDIFIAVKQ
jgi:predicted transcriptional regulator YdeE